MANRIRIGVLTGERPAIGQYPGLESALSRMEEYWERRFEDMEPLGCSLVLLPETCTTFPDLESSHRKEYHDYAYRYFLPFFSAKARELGAVVAFGTILTDEAGRRRNSLVAVDPKGVILERYDKVHPTMEEMEQDGIIPGKEGRILDLGLLRAGGLICFDLNFQDLREYYKRQKPDVILFASVFHGGLMQRYWAHSTRSHLVACVQGMPSGIISPTGEILCATTNYTHQASVVVNTDCALVHLDYNTGKLRELKQRYKDRVTVSDPGYLGAVLLSSEDDGMTVEEIMHEYGVVSLDEYLEKAQLMQDGIRN